MKPITNEQAELLRKQRSRCYELKRMVAGFAIILGNPLCQHEQLKEDLNTPCEYCDLLNPIYAAERNLELATELLDKALINGPKIRN